MCLVILSSLGQQVEGMPMQKFPQSKRGARAWSNVGKPGDDLLEDLDVQRLLVHSVDDHTGLMVYYPEVRKFLVMLVEKGVTSLSFGQLDRQLTKRLGALCYREQAGVH